MADDAVELIRHRNEFYRDNYRRVIVALFFMVVVNAGLVGVIFYQLTHRPPAQYFATSADGKIVKLQPLSEPVIGPNVLLQWAERAAVDSNSFDFVSYRKELQSVQNRFTPEGWDNFEAALKTSRRLETVIAKHLVVSAVATGAPTILDQGVVGGRYVWKVSLPILVTYNSGSEQTQQPQVVTMIISRVSTVNHPDGIAVVSYVAQEGQAQ